KSYHLTKNCSTLKRSKTINKVTLKQAKSQGKIDPCNVCVK
ncbi:cell wall-binding protein, partial [Clostridioides difficile]|nr:cell wall-binding protein [Clostridioides difficile]